MRTPYSVARAAHCGIVHRCLKCRAEGRWCNWEHLCAGLPEKLDAGLQFGEELSVHCLVSVSVLFLVLHHTTLLHHTFHTSTHLHY
uniref:Uncharacterized protein n=1 Tax=Anguilla anguilla TaxID=7936 RepID=A0A0E9W511_ANGAN